MADEEAPSGSDTSDESDGSNGSEKQHSQETIPDVSGQKSAQKGQRRRKRKQDQSSEKEQTEEKGQIWTLAQIKEEYQLTIPRIAKAADLESKVIYFAIVGRPIALWQADRIRRGLFTLTKRRWKAGTISFVLWENHRILWVVRASVKGRRHDDRYMLVYAQTEKTARALADSWLATLPTHPIHVFTPWRDGFQIGDVTVPGYR